MKVLHIDDSQVICDLYSEMFTADNHTIHSVIDGKEGLNLAVKNDYDLILVDMCMPKYSGLNFLHDLKIQRPSVLKKVVVVSVLKFNANQTKELMKYGIHSVEEKPSDILQLETLQKNMSLQ